MNQRLSRCQARAPRRAGPAARTSGRSEPGCRADRNRGTRSAGRAQSRLLRRLYQQVAADVAADGPAGEGRVLDVGTGPGRVPIAIARRLPRLHIDGIDLSANMIQHARERATAAGVRRGVTFVVIPGVFRSAADRTHRPTAAKSHWPARDPATVTPAATQRLLTCCRRVATDSS